METCSACGGKASGMCVRCHTNLCWRHVGTQVSEDQRRQYQPLNPVQAAHHTDRTGSGLKGGTLGQLMAEVNDLWLCGACLVAAEEAAVAAIDWSMAPPLPTTGDPIGRLLQLTDDVKQYWGYYPEEQWAAAVDAALDEAGGVVALCDRAAEKVWSEGERYVVSGRGGVFKRRDRKLVARAGLIRTGHSVTRSNWHEPEMVTYDKPLVVDGEGNWWVIRDGEQVPWVPVERTLNLAVEVAAKVLSGSPEIRLEHKHLHMNEYAAIKSDPAAVEAGLAVARPRR
ncbi:hypothetical protein [Blastococcus sp. SYSU D00820]